MRQITAFDFDGTLTTKDTLIEFIRYAKGNRSFIFGFLRYLPLLILMKLHLYPNYKAKQKVFSYFFKGMTIEAFNTLCKDFARDNRHLLRPKAVEALNQALADGDEVLIVSASVDNWVSEMITAPVVIGTKIEVKDGKLTGHFLTANCYGKEKVSRILQLYPHREDYRLTAYGDSRGDREMLSFADESYYKPFRV